MRWVTHGVRCEYGGHKNAGFVARPVQTPYGPLFPNGYARKGESFALAIWMLGMARYMGLAATVRLGTANNSFLMQMLSVLFFGHWTVNEAQ